eukprot:CAMPEP_0113321638 /NCGR_PEP_ID=MMETSP0010_2-20120614/15053_1 /TAXON_ID=216773 ORGANISM="Corethron hystrix, Strain 308" /NCGR_SAMPLE_ID=MMETSP0010_2 /ASSEMBLY_ACC=CAM_ASM_000155 /LENGTH=133 /DNA_ID=CAMNT_0000179833 /DNA_START=146 /DNA_END=543 /DNA_ORIENTATION=+ /assembly_acc=CAM_ASM_000155
MLAEAAAFTGIESRVDKRAAEEARARNYRKSAMKRVRDPLTKRFLPSLNDKVASPGTGLRVQNPTAMVVLPGSTQVTPAEPCGRRCSLSAMDSGETLENQKTPLPGKTVDRSADTQPPSHAAASTASTPPIVA